MAFTLSRINKLLAVFFIISGLIMARLFYLQVIEGPRLAVLGLGGRVQELPMEVARGDILDREGLLLTNTAQSFSVIVFPHQLEVTDNVVDNITRSLRIPADKLMARLSQADRPFKLKMGVDALTAQKINRFRHEGLIAIPEKMRYGHSSIAAHVVGYINLADNQGVSGIEESFDDVLRGSSPEYVAAIVDAGQQVIPGLGYKRLRLEVGSGPSNVVLTIDRRIQKVVERVLDKHITKGAVVVLRPSTGEILAMASRPNFDANNLTEYLQLEAAPLLNRAICAYQPGSVFKLVVAAAALETKVARPEDVFYDPGYIDVNNLRFKGWDFDRGARGLITFTEAMAFSSNPVLIQLALKLGPEKVCEYAQRLGFGERTNIELAGENAGNLPEPGQLYPGDLANLAIGQGQLEATPLQVASLVATIVNDGVRVNPFVVSKLTNVDGTIIKNYPISRGTRVLTRYTAAELRGMMEAVTMRGTGQAAYVEGFGAAGKTGSAETGKVDANGKSISHAWFVGYAPIETPQFVISVFVEEGMSGGDVAAPIFAEIANAILSPKDSQ